MDLSYLLSCLPGFNRKLTFLFSIHMLEDYRYYLVVNRPWFISKYAEGERVSDDNIRGKVMRGNGMEKLTHPS